MLNKIWPMLILISVFFSLITGNIKLLSETIFSSLENTVNFCLSFSGSMCFWAGITNIIKKSKLIEKIEEVINPFINLFFKKESSEVKKTITLNIVSNLLGIGNAATAEGIKAINQMNEENSSDGLTKEMNLFILINTLSIQLFPATLISIMSSMKSEKMGSILVLILVTSSVTFIIILFIGQICFKNSGD